jgi:hypothetical protein
VEDPKKRSNVTTAGKRKKRNKQQYQSMYNSEQEKRRKAEKLIADYEGNGYMTQNQFTELCKAKDDPATSRHVREALDSVFETAHTDPLTEIPILTDTKKDINNA